MAYVYILQSLKNSRYYIGSTLDINRRLEEHLLGKSRYTRINRPMKLVFTQRFTEYKLARRVETWLKKQKDKKLIQKIIIESKIRKFDLDG